jgi:hypothetical protein
MDFRWWRKRLREGYALIQLLLAMATGGRQQITQTFTSSTTWVCPAGVTNLETVSGYGARGNDEYDYLVAAYQGGYATETYYRDGRVESDFGSIPFTYGNEPADYCKTTEYSSNHPSGISHTTTCYSYSDASYYETQPTTTGSSTLAFGKTFPGSYGDVQPSTTTYSNIAVVPGQSYTLTVRGRITLNYWK